MAKETEATEDEELETGEDEELAEGETGEEGEGEETDLTAEEEAVIEDDPEFAKFAALYDALGEEKAVAAYHHLYPDADAGAAGAQPGAADEDDPDAAWEDHQHSQAVNALERQLWADYQATEQKEKTALSALESVEEKITTKAAELEEAKELNDAAKAAKLARELGVLEAKKIERSSEISQLKGAVQTAAQKWNNQDYWAKQLKQCDVNASDPRFPLLGKYKADYKRLTWEGQIPAGSKYTDVVKIISAERVKAGKPAVGANGAGKPADMTAAQKKVHWETIRKKLGAPGLQGATGGAAPVRGGGSTTVLSKERQKLEEQEPALRETRLIRENLEKQNAAAQKARKK